LFREDSRRFLFCQDVLQDSTARAGQASERLPGGVGTGIRWPDLPIFGVRYEDVRGQVLSGGTDAEVLEWCFSNGRRLTEEEILIYNSFISKRGWHDDETGVLGEMITQFGLRDDGRVLTYFDIIEMDEGRWYPDIWRDAWR
jgi:Domain of unknown function (DUF5069)